MSSIDPASMAQQLATYDTQGFQTRYNTQKSEYKNEQDALNDVQSALAKFQTSIKEMNSSTRSILKNSAKLSEDNFFSVNTDSTALSGRYQIFVQQVATVHQMTIGMPEQLTSDTAIPTTGTLDFTTNGQSLSIDLSGIDTNSDGNNTIAELINAINHADDNPGINATLVRSGGGTHFMLSSTKTGAENTISVSANRTGQSWFEDAFISQSTITEPKNAVIWLGAEKSGIKLTSSSNTFSDVIDGVDLTINKAQTSGNTPINMTIAPDAKASKEQVSNLTDAYNTLMSTIHKYTASGDENTQRGVLAGDSMIRALTNTISNQFRHEYDGNRLMGMGISIDRDGKLTLDEERFNDAQKNNRATLETMFNGDGNLFDSLNRALKPYLKSTDGLLSSRKDSLRQDINRIDERLDTLQRRYDSAYKRYLSQFTQMNNLMNQMQQTSTLFSV